MKKLFGLLCFTIMMALYVGQVQAHCGECEKGAKTASKCEAGDCASDCACPVGKAMAALPKMTYKVGDEVTCCADSAAALAKKADTHIHYVVSEKEFDSQEEAMVELAAVTTKFVDEFATPHKCEVSGKTSVAGQSLECEVSAGKMAEIAKKAMATVAMNYKVGDETCNCPNKAATLAKTSGKKQEFVIGEETTCCSVDAQIKLAHAKYRAAVKALAAASKPVEKEAASS